MTFSLATQIAEVEREIAMRRKVYDREVQARRMKEGEAGYKIGVMEAALASLKWLRQRERLIKHRMAQ